MSYRLYIAIDKSKYDLGIYESKVGISEKSNEELLARYKTYRPTIELVFNSPRNLTRKQAYEIEQHVLTTFEKERQNGTEWLIKHHKSLSLFIMNSIQLFNHPKTTKSDTKTRKNKDSIIFETTYKNTDIVDEFKKMSIKSKTVTNKVTRKVSIFS